VSVLARLVMATMNWWEAHILKAIAPVAGEIEFDPDHGKTRIRIERILADYNSLSCKLRWSSLDDGSGLQRLTLDLQLPVHHLLDMLDEIISEPAVKSVRRLSDKPLVVEPKQVF
jgi:hypothetical protein